VSLFSAEKVSELDRFWREMAPVPGRMAGSLRFALSAALATLLLLILQPPVGFIAPSLFMLFLVSRDTPFDCFRDLLTCVSFAALGTISALLMVIATGNHPVARVVGLAVFTFLATFFFRVSAIPIAPLAFGCLTYMVISLWEYQIRAEKVLHLSLWPLGTLATVAVSAIAVEYLFNRSNPLLTLESEIAARCNALGELFQVLARHADGARIGEQSSIVRRYAVTGEGRLHVLLERVAKTGSCSSEEFRKLTTITRIMDRLLVLGAGLSIHSDVEAFDPAWLECVGNAISAMGDGHLDSIEGILRVPKTPVPEELKLIERTLRHAGRSVPPHGTDSPQAAPYSRGSVTSFKNLLLPDAFTNIDYVMYAFKLSVCATICYVIYNGLGWPGISTAFFTVYFTGLSTTGASNRKLLFRVIGSTVGGLILGIGCMVFVFPNIEWVTSFLLVIAVLAFLGAWISASSYFGYIGLQIAFSFNLIAFERLRAPDQMTPARDRLLGIALGFLVMFFIFHQVRPERTVDTMRRLFARLLRGAAELVRLLGMEPSAERDAKIAAIRKQVSAGEGNLRIFADVVKFEFPPDRAASMQLSDQIMSAMTSAEGVLLAIPSWAYKLDQDQQQVRLKEIQTALEGGLRDLACAVEQLRQQQCDPLEAPLEKLPNLLPASVAKTIDSYRELTMVCAGIVRAAT